MSRLDGFVNVDVVDGCDLRLDLNREALPFPDGSVSCVFANHSLEHLENYLFALREIWRVLEHGGRLLIEVPYVTLTEYNLVNPYHKQHFNEYSFDFFEEGKLLNSANEESPIRLTKVWHEFIYLPEWEGTPEPELTYARRHYFNVVKAIRFGIVAVKPPHTRLQVEPGTAQALAEEFVRTRNARTWKK